MKVCLYIYLLLTLVSKAQNFVPNPSFEHYNNCPTAAAFYEVNSWCGLGGGEEAYNICFTTLYGPGGFGVPESSTGFQYPRTGNGYAGVLLYTPDPMKVNLREYLHAPLISSLQSNKTYCGTFYVNLINECKYATDRIGISLTSNSFACNQAMPSPQAIPTISITSQVDNPTGNLITDTLGWVEVSGTFTATGTESYLTIGNFHNDVNTSSNLFNPSASRTILYLLIDDVSIEEVFPVKAKNDTLIMQGDSVVVGENTSEAALYSWQPTTGLSCSGCANPKASPAVTTTYTVTKTQCKATTTDEITVSVSPTGIREQAFMNFIKISPNPTTGLLSIDIISKTNNEALTIEIKNCLGEVVFTAPFTSQINLFELTAGIYFLTLQSGYISRTLKIIKN